MAKDLNKSLDNVEMTYSQVAEIASSILQDILKPVDNIINVMGDDINSLSLDQLKDYMWKLQHKAYTLSEVKEKSLLKAELAEMIQKEKSANSYMQAEGTNEAKKSVALLESSEETVVQALYENISNQLKTKVDQIHRLVDCLKSIIMTRMQELKLSTAVE